MRSERLAGLQKKRFMTTTDSKHDDPTAPYLLRRNFTTYALNVAWVGDVTCVWTGQGWLYVAVLLDLIAPLGK